MPSQKLYSFLINGIECVSYVVKDTKIARSRFDLDGNVAEIHLVKTVSNIITLTAGQTVVISRGVTVATEDYIFRGNIKEVRTQDSKFVIICRDYLTQLKYKLITISYDRNIDTQAGEVSAIFSDLVTRAGFTPSVVSSGTGNNDITLDKFVSVSKSYQNRLDVLTKILNWLYYYDYNNNVVRLEPKGYVHSTTDLIVGQNVYNFPDWNQNLEPMRNKVTVEGATQLQTGRVANYTGDGSTKVFSIGEKVEAITVTVDSVLKTLGSTGSTSSYDYTLDNQLKQIEFVTAPALSKAIVITYTAYVLVPVTGQNVDSINKYGLTQEETFSFEDTVTTDDAETRVEQILDLLKDGVVEASLYTDVDIGVGNTVTVIDPIRPDKNGDYIVYSVTTNYPDWYDVVKLGNETFNVSNLFLSIDERLRALEKTDNTIVTILRQLISLLWSVTWDIRDLKKYNRDTTGDYLWNGTIWNGGLWQTNYINPLVLTTLIQGDNMYREFVYDNEYYDSGNSTGVVWDTSTKIITLTAGVLYTNKIFLGETYANGVLTTGATTGTLTYEISTDGKVTWQTLTKGVSSAFNLSDSTGVYLRISGTGTITNTYKDGGQYNIPAIQLVLNQ